MKRTYTVSMEPRDKRLATHLAKQRGCASLSHYIRRLIAEDALRHTTVITVGASVQSTKGA
jgi:hypothetical protein